MENLSENATLFLILPLVALVGLMLNLFIRARGGRSFKLEMKGFGIDLKVETSVRTDDTQGGKNEKD